MRLTLVRNATVLLELDGRACSSTPCSTPQVAEVTTRVPLVVVVHLEAINHCLESRAETRAAAPAALVPEDGETSDVDAVLAERLS